MPPMPRDAARLRQHRLACGRMLPQAGRRRHIRPVPWGITGASNPAPASVMPPAAVCTAAWCATCRVRLGKSVWFLLPGLALLALFAYLLTLVEADAAGRAYAAYGGIYVAAAALWL